MKIENRYLDGSYLGENPDWDRKDACWKATKVKDMLSKHKVSPLTLCEVGCGAGDILINLSREYSGAKLVGYDISPQVTKFWDEHQQRDKESTVEFFLGNFRSLNKDKFDVLLMLDVFEHVRDPYTFLEESRKHANYFVFHIPLDLSASSVVRSGPLMYTRKKVGHLHSYTKDLVLETLKDSGFNIVDWQYTGASLNAPNRSFKTMLAHFPRKLAYSINKDWAVRLLGGETLVVLARADQ